MIYICMNKNYLSKIIEREIRIPKLLVLYFRESHNYDPQLVTPVKNIHNINLTKEYKRKMRKNIRKVDDTIIPALLEL